MTITVDGDLSFTPIFEQDRANPMYTWIQVDAEAVEGKGTLSISPAPLNSFNEYDTPGHVSSTWYRYNRSTLSQATVSFTPAQGTTWSVREWRYTVGLPPGAEQVSTNATVSVPLDQEAHVRPVLGYRLTVNIEGDGAIHFGDPGTVYDTSPVVVDFPASQAVSVYTVPDAGSELVSWLGDAMGTANPLPLTMNADKNLTAVFSSAFDAGDVNLNVTVLGEGEIRVNAVPVSGSQRFVFDDNTQVQLEAVPAAGYDFIGWGGHLGGTTTPQNLLLDTSKSVSALFVPTGTTPQVQHAVHVVVEGNGSVSRGAAYCDPPQGSPGDDMAEFIARPAFGWRFSHWLVDGQVVDTIVLTFKPYASMIVTAVFEPGYSVVPVVNGIGGHIFFGNPSSFVLNAPNLWNAGYRLDGTETAMVTAVAAPGYRFSHWAGDLSGTNASMTFAVGSHRNIEAVFVAVYPYTIVAIGNGTIAATLNGVALAGDGTRFEGVADEGSVIVLTATPPAGYYLERWGGDVVRTGLNTAVLVLNEASEVRAYYLPYSVDLTVDVEHPEWGSVQVEPVKEEYFPGDVVQITAMPKKLCTVHAVTGDWQPADTLQDEPLVLRLSGDTTVDVEFAKPRSIEVHGIDVADLELTPEPIAQEGNTLIYNEGTAVSLTAVPPTGMRFKRWEQDVESSESSLNLTMNRDYVLEAVLGPAQPALSQWVHLNPEPTTIRPQPISSVAWGEEGRSYEYDTDDFVTIYWPYGEPTGLYTSGSYGGEWHVSRTSLDLALSQTPHTVYSRVMPYTEHFTRLSLHTIGRGRVLGGQGGGYGGVFVCNVNGDNLLGLASTGNNQVNLVAVPRPGWRFRDWSASPAPDGETGARVSWDMSTLEGPFNVSATARFEPIEPVQVRIESVGNGVTKPGQGSYDYAAGDTFVVDAVPGDGWVFRGWEDEDGQVLSLNRRTLMTAVDGRTIRAVFSVNSKLLTHIIGDGYVLRSPQGVFYPQVGTPPEDAVVRLEAVANADADFVQWEGSGVAYGTSALTNPLPMDNPSQPLNLSAIWVVMGPELPGGTRSITARFRCSCGCGAYVEQDDGERCETLCGEACVEVDLCPDNPDKMAPGACGCEAPDTDSDGDWVPDCDDGCPDEPGKSEEGDCGCYQFDIDNDGDGTPNCDDQCPFDPFKTEKGVCDCGTPDTDTDNDGTMDCDDACPANPLLIEEGPCGCDTTDTDSDGTLDCDDGCPTDPNKIVPGVCDCLVPDIDSDGDGTLDCQDGCPTNPDKTEEGICGCWFADVDSDGDGTLDCQDGCWLDPLKTEPGVCDCGTPDTDTHGDGTPDCQDGCPNNPDKTEEGVCGCWFPDTDSDGDGSLDCRDGCPNDPWKMSPGDCGCEVPESTGCEVEPVVIVLDPGHGGDGDDDNGAQNPNGCGAEDTQALELSFRVKEKLQARANSHVEVYLTRTSDVVVEFEDRAQVAKDHQAHALLSIHFNGGAFSPERMSAVVRLADGGQVNYSEDRLFAETVLGSANAAYSAASDEFYELPGGDSPFIEDDDLFVLSDRLYGEVDEENNAVSTFLLLALIEVNEIKNDTFTLKWCGISMSDFRDVVAEGIAEGILQALGVPLKP